MEEYLKQVLAGVAKPDPTILKIAQDEINKLDLPLGGEPIIMGEKHPIKNICDAIYLMGHMAALEVTLALLQIDVIRVRHKKIFEDVKYLIPYWYARRWIEPLPAYGKPLIKTKGDSYLSGNYLKQYLMGAKADQKTLKMIQSYMDLTMVQFFSKESGLTHANGVGPISRNDPLMKRFFQLLNTSGTKMANECFNLKNLNNQREIQQLNDDCFHILLFWIMKGWLKIPDLEENDPSPITSQILEFRDGGFTRILEFLFSKEKNPKILFEFIANRDKQFGNKKHRTTTIIVVDNPKIKKVYLEMSKSKDFDFPTLTIGEYDVFMKAWWKGYAEMSRNGQNRDGFNFALLARILFKKANEWEINQKISENIMAAFGLTRDGNWINENYRWIPVIGPKEGKISFVYTSSMSKRVKKGFWEFLKSSGSGIMKTMFEMSKLSR
ncbi:hypothetical protein DSAG12_00824 [Promethearchaeum syntrophicum]|uniref:Uncharacterized protein n=1 Tax=Promethearchaeum syntrophicum TaxID=2594042 RepID=A0A5B9D7L3_9ARCH|nr:hypothetical protein [Candidatus Prometheoarchaeum syntrophicum]QEE15001.1 hypothetical protein DSAG12_00824 [Candidatus Prometheoarchaeum syntrophicum]